MVTTNIVELKDVAFGSRHGVRGEGESVALADIDLDSRSVRRGHEGQSPQGVEHSWKH